MSDEFVTDGLGPLEYEGPLDLSGPPRRQVYAALLAETLGAAADRLGRAVPSSAFGGRDLAARPRRAEWRPPAAPSDDESPAAPLAPEEALRRILALHAEAPRPAPRFWRGDVDPYRLGWLAVAEAVGRAVAAGADPAALALDGLFTISHFDEPGALGGLVRCVQGCAAAALALGAPFVAGRVRMAKGGQPGEAGSVTVVVPGELADRPRARLQPGNFLFAVGQTRPELGGSDFARVGGGVRPQHHAAPRPLDAPRATLRAVARALREGPARACRACGPGGLVVALAEMCRASGAGAETQLGFVPVDPYYAYAADDAVLFAESPARFVVEVAPGDAAALAAVLVDAPHACFAVVGGDALRVHPRLPGAADPVLRLPVR